METDRLSDRDTKINGESQLAMVELGDINHCTGTLKSSSENRGKSGLVVTLYLYTYNSIQFLYMTIFKISRRIFFFLT